MFDIVKTLFEPQFSQLKLIPTNCKESFKPYGITYKPHPSTGKGFYWMFPIRNLCTITVMDLTYTSDIELIYTHPTFSTLGLYNSSMSDLIQGRHFNQRNNLIGYHRDRGHIDLVTPSGSHIHSVSITLSPDYYNTYLSKQYLTNLNYIPELFNKINGDFMPFELITIFQQLLNSNPSSATASLYYEGKILEAISILDSWHNNMLNRPDQMLFAEEDVALIHRVADFIKKNCEQHLTIEFLSRTFYINKNKLTYLFRAIYGLSIIDYTQQQRIQRAKHFLANSELSIQKIASMVGYKNQGSFSELFKSCENMSPTQYRKYIMYT